MPKTPLIGSLWGLIFLIIVVAVGWGQVAADQTRFEAASVKLAKPGAGAIPIARMQGGPGNGDPSHLSYESIPLINVITQAYKSERYQISGPKWLDDTRYDIAASLPPNSTADQCRLMLQNLLAERFKMSVHSESQQREGLALLQGPRSARLLSRDVSLPRVEPVKNGVTVDADGFPIRPNDSDGLHMVYVAGNCRVRAKDVTMAEILEYVMRQLEVPIVNETGLTDRYSFVLTYRVRRLSNRSEISESQTWPDLPAAIQSQLGLRLVRSKVSVKIIIIDHIDQAPVEN